MSICRGPARDHPTILVLVAGALLGSALFGCSPPPFDPADSWAAPIVGGQETTNFAEVGALLHGGDFLCSVVLVGARTALTAAHCTYGFENDLAPLRVRFEASIPAGEPDVGVAVEALRTHPDYATSPANDIAVVQLVDEPGVPPVPFSTIPLNANVLGEPLTLVGLGDSVLDDVGAPRRRFVSVALAELTATHLRWDGSTGGSCHGDSGGAVYADLGAGPVLLGVLSEGDPACDGWGSATRTDVFAAFIEDPGTGDDDDDATGGLLTGDDDDALPPPRACAQAGAPGAAAASWIAMFLWGRRRRATSSSRPLPPLPPAGSPLRP